MRKLISNSIVYSNLLSNFELKLTSSGLWQVGSRNAIFDLDKPSDFWRVVALLDRPLSEVRSILENETSGSARAAHRFPYWKVVSAGLTFGLDHWADAALAWFPQLARQEQVLLSNALKMVEHSAWAGPESRAAATQYVRQLHALCH